MASDGWIKCSDCGVPIHKSYPHSEISRGKYVCLNCAFRRGLIDSEYFCRLHGITLQGIRAGINPHTNEIEFTINKKFPWEKNDRDYRHDPSYITWRIGVFERDHYTCQVCGRIGGNLEAHHIKSFKKYKRYRLDINNGVTVCTKCHKKIHKTKDPKWIHV